MAELEKMIPHILTWEVGVKASEKGLAPKEMFRAVSSRGYCKIAGDSGGATMCGVTIGTFTDWRVAQGKPKPTEEELRHITYAEWLAILKQVFWDRCKGDQISNQSVAEMLVDWRWVNGTQAVRDAQFALGVVSDGVVGAKTLAALNSDARSVFTRLRAAREKSYRRIVERRPSQKKFLQGWLNRTNAITYKD